MHAYVHIIQMMVTSSGDVLLHVSGPPQIAAIEAQLQIMPGKAA